MGCLASEDVILTLENRCFDTVKNGVTVARP